MHSQMMAVVAGALGVAILGTSIFSAAAADPSKKKPPQRYGSVIGLRAEKLDEYKKLHAAIWPAVAKNITDLHIRNYSIYLRKLPDGNYYLFSYLEYSGDDIQADMAKMKANPDVQRWWKLTDPCQKPLPDRKEGEWWAPMEEVFHLD